MNIFYTYPKPLKIEKAKLKKLQKSLFLIVAIGLIPIALSYRLSQIIVLVFYLRLMSPISVLKPYYLLLIFIVTALLMIILL